ncbi:hypothetical protein [Neptunomonas sp.]|uniref:hypothetical protein n=1 Tax=Neptunomonas sp. TaxID=1971898 RepID=UPI003568B5F9
MQSSFKTSVLLFSALMACSSNLSTASDQTKPLSCRADNSMSIVASVDLAASMRLGQNYEFGEGVSQDNSQAFEWYCNAAMQNSPAAQLKIALFLLEGKGSQRNVSAGLAWLNRAANNGSHDAELALGILLVDTDAARSAVLFKRAADGGNLYANHRLAELYYYGIGVAQNYRKAQELSESGVAAGFEKSKELLTRIQVKQDSGIFEPISQSAYQSTPQATSQPAYQSSQPVVAERSVVSIEPQSSFQKEAQIEAEKELEKELQKSSSLLQRFLSILPSLPNTGGGNASAPSEVIVTTSQGVDVNDQSEELIPLSVSVSPAVARQANSHPVDVKSVISDMKESDTSVSVPDISVVESANRLSVADQQALEDQLVVAANNAIDEENQQQREQEAQLQNEQANQQKEAASQRASEKAKRVSNSGSADSHNYARDAGWINKQPKMRYTIQLVQSTHLDGIFKYIKSHNLDHDAYYIHALKDGEYRYILLYGKYPNNRTSKQVAKTLPDAVQKAGYWIRTFGDLRGSYTISP